MRHKNIWKQLIVSKGKGEDVQNRWAAKSLIWCNYFLSFLGGGFAFIASNLDSILYVYFECENTIKHHMSIKTVLTKSWHSDLSWWSDEEDSPNTWTCVGLHIFVEWQSPKKCHSDRKSSHWLADCHKLVSSIISFTTNELMNDLYV